MRCTRVGRPVKSTEGGEAAVRERAGKDSAAATRGGGSSTVSCSSSSKTMGAGSETSVGPPGSSETSSCSIVLSMVSTKWPCALPLCCGCCQPWRCPPPAPCTLLRWLLLLAWFSAFSRHSPRVCPAPG